MNIGFLIFIIIIGLLLIIAFFSELKKNIKYKNGIEIEMILEDVIYNKKEDNCCETYATGIYKYKYDGQEYHSKSTIWLTSGKRIIIGQKEKLNIDKNNPSEIIDKAVKNRWYFIFLIVGIVMILLAIYFIVVSI